MNGCDDNAVFLPDCTRMHELTWLVSRTLAHQLEPHDGVGTPHV